MAATRTRKTATTPDKEAEEKPTRKRGRPRKKPEPKPKPVVVEDDDDDDDDDDDNDYAAVASVMSEVKSSSKLLDDMPLREELLGGVDDESRIQNDTADSVMRRRAQGERHVHWKGNYNLKYNRVAEGCIAQFGGESEVEITRVMPKHAHVGIYALNQMPTWRHVTELIMNNHWDGSSQKYKIQIMSTGRSIAAVCYFTTEENIQRRREYERMMGNWNGPQQPEAPKEPAWQQQQQQQQQQPNQQGWQQPGQPPQQAQQPQPYGQGGGQGWQQQPQQQPQPDPNTPPWMQQANQGQQQGQGQQPPGWPQPLQGGLLGGMPPWAQPGLSGGFPGWPQPPQGGSAGGTPPWAQPNPSGGFPGWPQPPQPPQAQQSPEDEDDDDDDLDLDLDDFDDDSDSDDSSFSLPSMGRHQPVPMAPPRPDPKVKQMERTVRTLQKELRRMERKNKRDMSQSSNYQAYMQQLQIWQMLQGFGQQVEAMKSALVEEKRKVQEQQQQQQQQVPPHNNMTMEQIVQLVQQSMQETFAQQRQQQESVRQQPEPQPQPALPNPTQFTPQQMQMLQAMGYSTSGMPSPSMPAQQSDEDELEKTLRKFGRMQEMMQKFAPKQPEPPPWMQTMMQPHMAAPNPAQPSEAKADDGSPLKVFDMGPFRYVTDQQGKAVDFFTMMALNADNVKSWVEPALGAIREVREQIKDARKQQDTGEVVQMLEMMHHRMLQNQQIHDQQIAELSRRLAPSQETLAAMQQGRIEPAAAPAAPAPAKPENPPSQHGPKASGAVPSKASAPRGLLDGLAHAKRALQKQSPPGDDRSQGQ